MLQKSINDFFSFLYFGHYDLLKKIYSSIFFCSFSNLDNVLLPEISFTISIEVAEKRLNLITDLPFFVILIPLDSLNESFHF